MGFLFGPFDISGSIVTFSGSLNTTGSLNTSGSVSTVGSLITSGSINLTGSISSTGIKSTLSFDDMLIYHTSGSASFFCGVGIPITASIQGFGGGIGSGSTLILLPTASAPYAKYQAFSTVYKNAKIVGYRMYTNVSGSDFPQYDYNSNGPRIGSVNIGIVYKTAPNSVSTGYQVQNLMYSLTSGSYDGADGNWSLFDPGAVINTPNEILDAGTLYVSSSANIDIAPTPYSPKYFTFAMSIGAAFATKTYKYRFELDIEDQGW